MSLRAQRSEAWQSQLFILYHFVFLSFRPTGEISSVAHASCSRYVIPPSSE